MFHGAQRASTSKLPYKVPGLSHELFKLSESCCVINSTHYIQPLPRNIGSWNSSSNFLNKEKFLNHLQNSFLIFKCLHFSRFTGLLGSQTPVLSYLFQMKSLSQWPQLIRYALSCLIQNNKDYTIPCNLMQGEETAKCPKPSDITMTGGKAVASALIPCYQQGTVDTT